MSKSSPVNSASAIANDLFDQFIAASNLKGVVTTFRKICHELDLTPGPFNVFYPALKHGLSGGKHKQLKNWKAASIFNKIDKKASNRIYTAPSNINSFNTNDTSYAGSFGSGGNNNSHRNSATATAANTARQFGASCTTTPATTTGDNGNCNNVHNASNNNILSEHNCLIIGGGPCGLRTAIELQLLGAANVVVVEKRDRFSRNNVLHLWPFVIADLKQMAGKKFYGKFCAGSIDHVSIRQLQLMLLKFALILGVNFVENITFEEMCPRSLTVSLSKRQMSTSTCTSTSTANTNGQCKSGCNCHVTCMSQQLNLKSNCDECCLNCTSDDVTDGNVLTNCCTGGNKRRHTGNTSRNIMTTTSTTTTTGGTGNDVNELLKNSSTKLLTPPSSSSSMDDEDFADEEEDDDDEEQKVPQMDECINSRTESRRKITRPRGECKSVNQHEFTNGMVENDDNNVNGDDGDDENCKKLHINSSGSFKNVNCSCCCHLHSVKNLNFNCESDARGKWTPKFTSSTSTSTCSSVNNSSKTGAFAHFSITSVNPTTASDLVNYSEILVKLHKINFDVVLGADGRRATLSDYFPRKEFRGRLAIAITANFVNTHTLEEARIPEISGISFIYNQQLFKSLYDDKGIDLENICYYKDDTHYFVMTAKKSSLLERKVLYSDHADTRALLAPENINRSQLLEYAKDAAKWTTGLEQPLAINHYGEPDVAMFDFTSMYAAENACRAKKINRHIECNCNCKNSSHSSMANGTSEQTTCKSNESLLLVGLVGDSLLEPFWPTGSGCARGFLSAMDSAWMVRQWALKRCSTNFNEEEILSVLQEREAIYRLLGQTKSENLNQNYASYTLNPLTRYPNLNSSKLLAHQCRHLLFDDIAAPATNDLRSSVKQTLAAKRLRRATIASSLPFTSGILDGDAFNNRNLMSESIGEESTLTCTNSNDTLMKEEEEEDADEVPNERLVKKSTSAALKREFLNNSHSSNSSLNASKVNTGESSKKRSLVYDAEANDAFEKSLADFEKSYIRGIKSNTDHNYSNGSNSNLTQISSLSTTGKTGGKSLNKSSTFSDVILSPSANNLASIGKSRAKEIEAALRHRRQQASAFNRSEQNCNSPVRSASQKYSKDEHSNRSDSKVSLDKSKFAWLLDHETSGQLSDNPKSDTAAAKSTREPFVSRVKNLEAKLSTASSGIHYFDPAYDNEDTIDRKKIASKGSNVMAAASTLQQLLNPSFQENKLKERALDYRKKNSDIKVVMKMTDETDWNKKKWSQRELQAQEEKKAKPPTNLAPRPKELLDLFIGKKHEIEEKLTEKKAEEIKLMNTTSTRRQRSRRADDNEWIAILKGELNERSASPKDLPRQTAKAPFKSPFADPEAESHVQEKGRAKFQFMPKCDTRDRESKMARPKEITDTPTGASSTGKSSLCVRCKNQVALVDRILISGFLIHRSCLTCSKCHVTLRLSEVRSNNFVDHVDLTSFNYLCILCSKNKVNSRSNLATSASTSSVITGKPPLDCISVPDSNGKTKSRPRSPVSSLHERLEKEKNHQQSMASFAATDEYELRLKERMKWKEQFLMNNNNDFDLGVLIQRQILKGKDSNAGEGSSEAETSNLSLGPAEFKRESSVDRTDSSTETTDATSGTSGKATGETGSNVNRKINERIGYENTSRTRELFDDDELTKLLNLESDQWESGEEEEEASTSSSESDQRSEDSTEADFDSDEAFDASTASKLKSFTAPEDENQDLPEIVIETTDPGDEEVGTATGDEIDTTGVLDIGSNESKGQTTTITNLTNEADHSSSESDTLAGEATDSNLVEDEERVKLLNSSGTTSNSKSSSDRPVNCSTDETESEIWSESNKSSNKDNKSKPKKPLATLAEMESIGGSMEALPLVDNESNNFLSPNKDTTTSTTVATIGSPAITKSYTVSPSSFESKSSCNTLNSPSLLRSISVSPETSNTPVTSESNVRSPLNNLINSNLQSNYNWNACKSNLTENSSNQSETLVASIGNNFTYTGLSNATCTSPGVTSECKLRENQNNSQGPCSIVTTINDSNNSISSGNCDTSKQVGSSLFVTSSNFSPRSNSFDAQNTTATSYSSVSQFNTNLINQSSKFNINKFNQSANAIASGNYTTNCNVTSSSANADLNECTTGRVKTFTSQFNCLDSVKNSSATTSTTTTTSPSSSSPGFRVAQPKITVFNLDAYKLPNSNISGSSSGLNKSNLEHQTDASPSPPIYSFNRNHPLHLVNHQTAQVDSSVDSFTEDSSQAVISSSNVTPHSSSTTESYSRIPVLSKRTLPAYRGSFTDKLLERCRSTPSLESSPEGRKLSLVSSPATTGVAVPPSQPQQSSVLAKWACSNLLQMSTHEVGATPQLPFLKNDKLQLSNSNINCCNNLHRNYNNPVNASNTFGKNYIDRSNLTHNEGGHSLKYDNLRSNYSSASSNQNNRQQNGQSSSLHIEINPNSYLQSSSKLSQTPCFTSPPVTYSNGDRHLSNIRSNYYSSPQPPPTSSSPSAFASPNLMTSASNVSYKNHLHPSPLANESPTANSASTTNGYLGRQN